MPAATPRSSAGRGSRRADHRRGRQQVRELRAIDARDGEQRRVVVDVAEIAVVGEPVQGDRVERRRGDTGELEVQPVLRLQVLPGRARRFGLVLLQPQDVRDRVLARARRRATGEADPTSQLARVVSLHAHCAADALAHRVRAARIHPDDRVPQRPPGAIDRHGSRPLRRDRDADDGVDRDRAASDDALARVGDRAPPVRGPLLGSAVLREQQLDGRAVAVHERAVDGEDRDLRAGRTEIDREDVLGHDSPGVRRLRPWPKKPPTGRACAW